MVKLADIPKYERNHLMSKLLPPLGKLPWVVNDKPLSEKKVAIITTAGLNFREDHNFEFVDSSYRALPARSRRLRHPDDSRLGELRPKRISGGHQRGVPR